MQPEFPHLVPPDQIARGIAQGRLAATPEQRTAIARRLKIPAVKSFAVSFHFTPTIWAKVFRLQGHIDAVVEEECVLTLDRLPRTLESPFECLCGPENVLAKLEDMGVLDADMDPPEPMGEEGIDVGEVAVQYLALALDAYPRQPDLTLEQRLQQVGTIQQDNPSPARQPFAQLANLQPKLQRS